MAGINDDQAICTSRKYTLNAVNTRDTPKVKMENNSSTGMNISASQPSRIPNSAIMMEKGISMRKNPTKEEYIPPSGMAMAGMLTLFITPVLRVMDSMIWMLVVVNRVQNSKPLSTYNG